MASAALDLPLAAALGDLPGQVGFQTAGMLVVLLALGGLWLLLEVLGRVLRPAGAAATAGTGSPAVAAELAAPRSDAIAPEVAAVIAAAVAVSLGARARVVAVAVEPTYAAAWSAEGRRDLARSHRPR